MYAGSVLFSTKEPHFGYCQCTQPHRADFTAVYAKWNELQGYKPEKQWTKESADLMKTIMRKEIVRVLLQ